MPSPFSSVARVSYSNLWDLDEIDLDGDSGDGICICGDPSCPGECDDYFSSFDEADADYAYDAIYACDE